MNKIEGMYTVKGIGLQKYYLGNDYRKDKKGRWCIGCKKYLKEEIKQVEGIYGILKKKRIPSKAGDHLEINESKLLDGKEYQKYQMLIRILV